MNIYTKQQYINGEGCIMEKIAQNIDAYIQTCLNSKEVHGVYIWGSTSTGKSYNIVNAIETHKADKNVRVINAHTTPLSLFLTLRDYPNDIFYFDDLDKYSPEMIGLLKGALWETQRGQRMICWLTTSDLVQGSGQNGTLQQFEFNGKLIFSSNINPYTDALKPLVARMFVLEHEIKYKEFLKICETIFSSHKLLDKDKEIIREMLSPVCRDLNFRTVVKAIELIKFNKYEQVPLLFERDEELEFVYKEMSGTRPKHEVIAEYKLKFGKSHRTYYNTVKKLTKIIGRNENE